MRTLLATLAGRVERGVARRARPLAHLLAPGVTRELLVLAQKRERNSEISWRRARIPRPPPRPDDEAAPTAKGGGAGDRAGGRGRGTGLRGEAGLVPVRGGGAGGWVRGCRRGPADAKLRRSDELLN